MKKIFNYITLFAGFLAFAPLSFGQVSAEGVVLDKKVDQTPDENGVRWITLESFVTGTVTVRTSSVPSDVILVLDVSSSMEETYTTISSYTSVSSISYNSNQNNAYYKEGDEYHKITISRSGRQNNYTYSFSYTNSAGSTVSLQSGSSATYTGANLYTANTTSTTRIEALKDAAKEFVASIKENAESSTATDENYDGNRIGIITYSSSAKDVTGGWLDSVDDYDELIADIGEISTATGTRTDEGLKMAIENYLDGSLNSARDNANLTVVMFTDGCPSTSGSTNFTASYADDALNYAKTIKALKPSGSEDSTVSKVFSVGLLNNNDSGQDYYKKVVYFLDLLSSNYPNAEVSTDNHNWSVSGNTVTVNGLTAGNPKGSDDTTEYFQLVDENTDLSSIFEAISKDAGGSASSITEDAVVEVDVVSNSFALPSGGLASNYEPMIYVAKCTGYDSDGKGNAFDADGDGIDNEDHDDWIYIENKENNMINVDGSTSTISITVDGNEISTTGFNFALNWCGRHSDDAHKTTSNPEGYYADGYKLIVKIPIVVNEDAVGGAGTATNAPGSGLKVDGVLIAEFPQPSIDIPINLWVMKTGLEGYENAHFKVYQIDPSTSKETLYTEFFLTGGLNEETVSYTVGGATNEYTGPMIKLLGLDGNYNYRVDEEKWSWQYTGMPLTVKTTADLSTNPMIFVNSINETSVLHAESKAANNFATGSADTYSSRHYGEAETK